MARLWEATGIAAAVSFTAAAMGQETGLTFAGPMIPVQQSMLTAMPETTASFDEQSSLSVPTLDDADPGVALLPALTVMQDPMSEPEPVEEIILEGGGYQGGQGLVTAQGMRGMFLNPTSGTLDQGQFTIQYCVLLFQNDGPNNTGHGLLTTYGVTDWLEAGVFILFVDANAIGDQFIVGGPQVRVRLVKDGEHSDWMPEISVGGIALLGDDEVERYELDLMLSKLFPLDPEGTVRGFRLHGGLRQIWLDDDFAPTDSATLVFVGGELLLPWDLSLIAEVSSKDDLHDHNPWAVGVQWRPTGVVGLSFALTEPGGIGNRLSPFIGIGLNFEF